MQNLGAGKKGEAQWPGLSCPKGFLCLLGEREGSCALLILQFHFNLRFLLLKYNVHHLGSVHVTENSPGIS